MSDPFRSSATPALPAESLRQLERIAVTLASAISPSALASTAVQIVEEVVDCDYLAIYVRDASTGAAKLLAHFGFSDAERDAAEASAWERHPGRVMRTGERVIVRDMEIDPQGTITSPRSARVRSRVFLPIRSQDAIVGAFGMASARPNAFEDHHLATLEFACSMIGVVWEKLEARRMQAEIEERLARGQKMELVGRVAGSVAHDFNNMLSVLLAQADLLESRHRDARTREQVQAIKLTCERAGMLTRRLLAFTRREPARPVAVDLREELTRFRRVSDAIVPETIEVRVSLPDKRTVVQIDVGEFEQVLLNLVINACDAMPPGGELQITLERAEAPDERAILSVRDSGEGIPHALRDRIFEPFVTSKSPGKGTGLGLSTAKDILERFGGTIRFEDQPCGGTAFVFELPCVDAAPHVPPERRTVTQQTHVLVVEDEELLRTLLARSLASSGYEVTCKANGREALDWLSEASDPPRLIVTDIVMPRLNGVEFVEAYAEQGEPFDVVFITGYESDTRLDRIKAFAPRVRSTLLRKPFRPHQLVDALESFVASAEAARP